MKQQGGHDPEASPYSHHHVEAESRAQQQRRTDEPIAQEAVYGEQKQDESNRLRLEGADDPVAANGRLIYEQPCQYAQRRHPQFDLHLLGDLKQCHDR